MSYYHGNDNANFGNGQLVDQGLYFNNEDPVYHVQHDDALVRRAAEYRVITPQELLEADEHCIRK